MNLLKIYLMLKMVFKYIKFINIHHKKIIKIKYFVN